ncbi:MAG: VOC family protein [Pseudomonadota bacterium]
MIKKIHHVAIAVKNLNKSLSVYTDVLGLRARVQELEAYSLRLAFIEVGEVLIELLQPTSENDQLGLYEFMQEKGEGLHHIAYEVIDIQKTIKLLKENQVRMIDESPKPGADGIIAFAERESMGGVLVEFVERVKE